MTTLEIKTSPWYDTAHHRGSGFRNPWGPPPDIPAWKTARWVAGHAFQRKENTLPAVRTVDPNALATPPSRLRITWLGHAVAYIQTPTLNLLTDPMFGERASPLSFAGPARETPLPLRPEALPGVDVVLLSHDHYDHLDKGSIQLLQRHFAPLFLVPLGLRDLLMEWGAERVVELDWWQHVDVGGLRYHCTPARHFSGRGLFNRDGTLWASWYLEGGSTDGQGGDAFRLFFAGDTGYGSHFTEVRERLGAPEVALIPIGAYRPRWFMEAVHVDPAEAVQAAVDLQADHTIAIHWGVFDLADEPMHEPPTLAREAAKALGLSDRFHILDIGATLPFEAPAHVSTAATAQ